MYTDDYSDKESDYDEPSPDDSPKNPRKSASTVCFRNQIDEHVARPQALRATQSFTGTIDELKLASNLQRINLKGPGLVPSQTICPCGCLLRPITVVPFRTREKSTLALHVVPPEVLHHHGNNYEPSQIAMFWKKDCRTFLWKGKSKKSDLIHVESYKENDF